MHFKTFINASEFHDLFRITSRYWTVYKINAKFFSLLRQDLRYKRIYCAAIDQQSVPSRCTESTKREKRFGYFFFKDNTLDKLRGYLRDNTITYLPQ